MALPLVFITRQLTGQVSLKISRLDIYFHQNNATEHQEALELRDAVLRLRRDGAFVAVPLFRVNTGPIGPHPVGAFTFQVLGCLTRSHWLQRLLRDLVG
jgi:hypothetical protein